MHAWLARAQVRSCAPAIGSICANGSPRDCIFDRLFCHNLSSTASFLLRLAPRRLIISTFCRHVCFRFSHGTIAYLCILLHTIASPLVCSFPSCDFSRVIQRPFAPSLWLERTNTIYYVSALPQLACRSPLCPCSKWRLGKQSSI